MCVSCDQDMIATCEGIRRYIIKNVAFAMSLRHHEFFGLKYVTLAVHLDLNACIFFTLVFYATVVTICDGDVTSAVFVFPLPVMFVICMFGFTIS